MLLKFIVFSSSQWKLLLCRKHRTYALPSFHLERLHVAVTSPINDFFKREFDLEVNVLRGYYQDEAIRIYEIEVLDNYSSERVGLVWLDPISIPSLAAIHPNERKVLLDWSAKDDNRAFAWFQFGWRQRMEAWVKQKLPYYPITFVQIRSWERAALWKIKTNQANYYLKAVPDVFSHEPSIHNYLAEHYPSYVPEVIALDLENNWYIMGELQGDLLGNSTNRSHWEDALYRMGNIQKEAHIHKDKLRKLGCPVRPIIEILNNHLEESLSELVSSNNISLEKHIALKMSIPSMLSLAKGLRESKLPISLDHGDLFGGNIMVHHGEPIIYDWSDSSLTHPFLSVIVLLEEVNEYFSEQISQQLLDVYLEEWRMFDSLARLYEEFRLVRVLAPLYYLTVHQRFIFPALEDNVDKQQIIDHYVEKWLLQLSKMDHSIK
ncbi:aminoglycoside phosphotransferase family protein [Virgibacillus sp. NKC19-3]|uniref:phosphotransferase n=1 Tax=Virgibacillus saliphilus TaxID=2831674 RepID=UPI001C9A9D50|nr:phosphotransferase [Virgibacillus sp. NKC19-3]MBY7144816.1 aminoglycoside phosphotransferase family protein [Virgibacillus sp. NKC19-3]